MLPPCGTTTRGCDGSQAGKGVGKPQASATLANGLVNAFAGPHVVPAPRPVRASSALHEDFGSSCTRVAAMLDEAAARVWLEAKTPSSTATSPFDSVSPFALIASAASRT